MEDNHGAGRKTPSSTVRMLETARVPSGFEGGRSRGYWSGFSIFFAQCAPFDTLGFGCVAPAFVERRFALTAVDLQRPPIHRTGDGFV